jgi:hypothetical protein
MDAKPMEEADSLWELGLITACALQNETTDDLYLKTSLMVDAFAKNLGLRPRIVLRLHSVSAEIKAVVSMARPTYSPDEHQQPALLDSKAKAEGVVQQNLLEHYLRQTHGNINPGIKDGRIKQLDGSAAKYILRKLT